MTDAPERIWIAAFGGNWSPCSGKTQDVEYARADLHRIIALDALASETQAQDAYAAQLKAEAMAEKLAEALTQIRNYCANGPISQNEINCAVWANTALAEYEASK